MAYIVVATSNAHKVEEYAKLLEGQKVELKSLLDYPNFPGVEEDGATFRENAAEEGAGRLQVRDVAGVRRRLRARGRGARRPPRHLLGPLRADRQRADCEAARGAKDKENRRARFVCAIAIAINGEVIETFEGEVKGSIVDAPRGADGFGYDPIFLPDGYDQTFGEMPQELKNRISHRAAAFKMALNFVEDEMSVLDDDFDL